MRVELRHISKSFGPLRANDAISLTFEPGRIYGLLGENGAGKSTLMKILSGFQRPDGGQIVLDGRPLAFAAPAEALAAGVGMLYQDPLDLPPFRVIDNYLLGWPSGLRLDYAAAATELRALAGRYHFTLDLQAPVDSLSLGERQQLELMRLLAGGAKVLILDEPTTGISAEQKDTLFASMRRLAFDEGKTLILVSHKLAEVQELCQHAFVLRRGRLAGETSLPAPTERLVGLMFGQAPARQRRPALPPGAPVLDVDKVSLSDGRLACEDINLSLHSGEVFGLAGLEGSGQRLLLRACAGLLAPRRGRIRLRGQDVTGWPYQRRRAAGVAYMAAGRLEEGLVADLTLSEHLALAQPEPAFFVDRTRARQQMAERIEKYAIQGRPETVAAALSGGNQQRLLFALLGEPLALLLEDPTRGLDLRSTNDIWELLYARLADGATILFTSADLEEIIERSDRIAVFSAGRMSRILLAGETSLDELGHLIGGEA